MLPEVRTDDALPIVEVYLYVNIYSLFPPVNNGEGEGGGERIEEKKRNPLV